MVTNPPRRSAATPLAGSHRAAAPASTPVGPVDGQDRAVVTLVLRRRGTLPDVGGPLLSRAELAERAGARPDDIALVVGLLRAHGLEVLSATQDTAADRLVRVTGPVTVLAGLFGTSLELVASADPRSGLAVTHRQRTGELMLPAELTDVVTAVLGLDDRPQARPQFRVAHAAAAQRSYTPLQLGHAYRFPPGSDGSGQSLAIVELGGGFGPADVKQYFASLGVPPPRITAVGVDGAKNVPGKDPGGADGEVLLDIEVAGALAPGASLVVYFAPNTDAGFLDAVTAAAHASPIPTALSISWGQQEDAWTGQARQAMDQAFADAAALGVTVCVASGDDGSADRATDKRPHVDFPAASPHALACGGTTLQLNPTSGAITLETVWHHRGHGATGGGVSDTFPMPVWQQHAGVPAGPGGHAGRGVPDVAGNADPGTGYQVLVDGTPQVIGGTSAVAPLWAALVCRLAEALGRPLGLLQPALYAAAPAGHTAPGLRDITQGNNGAFKAGPGWDACTGLGSPDGIALLALLAAAGPPS